MTIEMPAVTRWEDTATLDCQPEDAISEAGVPVCRLRLVRFPEGETESATRTTAYLTGHLAERCRDGLNDGDEVSVIGLRPEWVRPGARHPEVIVPDTPGAVRLRGRAPQIADAARGARLPQTRARVVHCMEDDYDIYIGRGRDPHTHGLGKLGNRYSHKPSDVPGVVQVASAEEAVRLFRADLWAKIRAGKITLEELAALNGKTLGCWCGTSSPCHGFVLADAATWAVGQLRAGAEA